MTKVQLFMPFLGLHRLVKFINRPQRFLAEIRFSNGTKAISHCTNPGAFKGCLHSGSEALVFDSKDLKRKRRYTWRAVKINDVWVGTDTHIVNQLVERALRFKLFPGIEGYKKFEREQAIAGGVRIDFLLSGEDGLCFIEAKSATTVENGIARFPDSITPRSLKHLKVLTQKAKQGHRAMLVFVVQRDDATAFTLNEGYYPAYTNAYKRALKAGVEIFALAIRVSPKGFDRPRLLPCAMI